MRFFISQLPCVPPRLAHKGQAGLARRLPKYSVNLRQSIQDRGSASDFSSCRFVGIRG